MSIESQKQAIEDPETLWILEEKNIKEKLLKTFDFPDLKRWGYTKEEIEERKQKMVEREKKFFIKVLSGIEGAKEKNQKIKVLFDIDETIGSPEITATGKIITALRPSLLTLFERIRSMGAEIGFITSRGEKAIREQFNDEQNFLPVKEFINQELIFSSRKFNYEDDSEFRQKMINEFGGPNGIIDDTISYDKCPILGGDQTKLKLLKQIKGKFKEEAIVIVDDLYYPNLLNTKNKLYGVSLQEDAMFTRP